jgi:AcrR family transcriptional regulator
MSKNNHSTQPKAQAKQPQKMDLRVRRTRDRLGNALITLMQEKPIAEITVQQVLDRAAVGRSTFYLHFRDTDDLLLTQLEHFLELMSTALSKRNEQSDRVAPVAEMFAHIGEQKKMWRALADAGRLADFFDLAQEYFSRGIEQRLKELKRTPEVSKTELTARSHALAGSLLSLLRWWIDRGTRESAKSMDELFHRIVWGRQSRTAPLRRS